MQLALKKDCFLLGKTTLTSPSFDLSEMENPQIGYHTNFGNAILGFEFLQGEDTLYVYLENGIDKVVIDKITTDLDIENLSLPKWRNSSIQVKDFISPSETMRISFEINSTNENSVIKAGVDNFVVWDATTVGINDFIQEDLNFNVYPNPIQDYVYIQYDFQQWATTPDVFVYDVLGKTIYQQELAANQLVNFPTNLTAGIYFIQLVGATQGSPLIKLVKN